MKILILILFFISFSFSSSQNVSLMNDIKSVIQKEEYISLAINKYILQNAKIPKKDDNTLDWDELMTSDYLGINFNRYNPMTKQNISVVFDSNNSAFIKGVFEAENQHKSEYNYLYNFYINKIFRVNTIPPKNNTKTELLKGSLVLYNSIQNEIVKVINRNTNKIFLPTQTCEVGNYYYELKNEKLIYKYCKTTTSSIEVYQESPIYLDNLDDLKYIKVEIGEKAYVKDGISWYEYYYEGNGSWIPLGTGRTTGQVNDEISIEDRILSYIPDAKDLVLRRDGGCMLANGDIFCWGNNSYKKAGIENYGQLDKTIKPDYVNTPVMLKVQIEDIKQNEMKWYNNPYRVKFEKMAMNSTNVCGISPIFDYYESGIRYKIGGDLYCNGYLTSENFVVDNNSILRRYKKLDTYGIKGEYNSNAIYLKDIVMVNGTIILLSDEGFIYTTGSNDKGSLGSGNNNFNLNTQDLLRINPSDIYFKRIYALRDVKGFGALDENNNFWIWGERQNGTIYNKPIILSNSKRFNEDGIFVNSKEFVLKGVDNKYYRTYDDISVKDLDIDGGALSVSIYDYNNKELLIYVDKNMQLQGSSELLTCMDKNFDSCGTQDEVIFSTALSELNSLTNTINNSLYANFSNISIFEGKTNKSVVDYGTDYTEDFENGSTSGWTPSNYLYDGGSLTGKFLGLFNGNYTLNGSQTIYKTFSLGSEWANKSIKISFDMYEIGDWSGTALDGYEDAFFVYVDNVLKSRTSYKASDSVGDYLGILPNGNKVQSHEYILAITLDSTGSFKLGFGATIGGYNGSSDNKESFGINNIVVSKQIDNVTFTGNTYLEDFEDENHDYWIVPPGPVPYTKTSDEFYYYPIYIDSGAATKFLGRFNKKSSGGTIYHGNSDGTEEVYKVFSFGAENANKQVKIEYDFYRIDSWRYNTWYTIDRFYTFVNGTRYLTYSTNDSVSSTNLSQIDNTSSTADYKFHFTRTEYLDNFGNIRLGFGAYILDNYIDSTSWGIDNVKFTLTGNTNTSGGSSSTSMREVSVPTICAMTGIGSASQMYCWGNVGRSIPILSTSLYDVGKISTINKLFISPKSDEMSQMAFDNFDNSGNLFLKYPTYIGGFDYPFYFK